MLFLIACVQIFILMIVMGCGIHLGIHTPEFMSSLVERFKDWRASRKQSATVVNLVK